MKEQVIECQFYTEHFIWFCIAMAEFVIILAGFLYWKYTVSERGKLKKRILTNSVVDFGNVIDSSFQAKPLYDLLKTKCHPDRFLDDHEKQVATEIFARLVKHKYDYKTLLQLKEEAIKRLNLKL